MYKRQQQGEDTLFHLNTDLLAVGDHAAGHGDVVLAGLLGQRTPDRLGHLLGIVFGDLAHKPGDLAYGEDDKDTEGKPTGDLVFTIDLVGAA